MQLMVPHTERVTALETDFVATSQELDKIRNSLKEAEGRSNTDALIVRALLRSPVISESATAQLAKCCHSKQRIFPFYRKPQA
jgi:hypothetical protein